MIPASLQCPQCGAPLTVETAAAVMIVCASCRSTITRDADGARRVGRMAELVEDGSPVRLGTHGRCGERGFRVAGRLRLRYDDGEWNEWFIEFDRGGTGWLSDASAQYAVTELRDDAAAVALVPSFAGVAVGGPIKVADVLYSVSDVRTARCVGGEGELPMIVGDGWTARVVDARRGAAFVTVDYSDGTPVAYVGATDAITFDAATLRARDDVLASAIGYRGDIVPLACPQCAGPITVVAAMATAVVCPYCGSELDCSGPRAEILSAAHRVASFRPTLPLGTTGTLDGIAYTLIGAIRCSVPGDASEPAWTEYLLFSPRAGYLWLVETVEGWQRVQVCDTWPTDVDNASCRYAGRAWRRRYAYASRVDEVFGAFNWRVRRGDVTTITEYVNRTESLNKESTDEEVTWSLASPVASETLRRAFKAAIPPVPSPRVAPLPSISRVSDDDGDLTGPAVVASIMLLVLNSAVTPAALLIGLALVWAPILLRGWADD